MTLQSDALSEFLAGYSRQYDHYSALAEKAARICEKALKERGIRAQVTCRAKRPERLAIKLKQRAERKHYKEVSDIYRDIVDLAGVRIALYSPGKRNEVMQLIEKSFKVEDTKPFGGSDEKKTGSYIRRFPGYIATHYRVKLIGLTEEEQRYENDLIEIQVASVLMLAWSEVEHDMIYKPLSGTVSDEEYAILDEVNGLVLAGEIALERLQQAVDLRVSQPASTFNNHYELASYLFDHFTEVNFPEPAVGRADLLLGFLKKLGKDKTGDLAQYLTFVDPQKESSLVEQLLDLIVEGRADKYSLLIETRRDLSGKNPYSYLEDAKNDSALLGDFVGSWLKLEKSIRNITEMDSQAPWSRRLLNAPASIKDEFSRLRIVRNQVLHGELELAEDELRQAVLDLKDLAKRIEGQDYDD